MTALFTGIIILTAHRAYVAHRAATKSILSLFFSGALAVYGEETVKCQDHLNKQQRNIMKPDLGLDQDKTS